ncbi:MAG TPA: sialidase family protein [Gemmatimonadota bacterium]|nr:sialidase family protein [Gemmatimonadota bacterium]
MKRLSAVTLAALLVACGEVTEKPSNDVLVNDPSVDRGNSTTQSETAVARYADVVVVGYNDSGDFTRARSMTGYAYSLDGGVTFVDAGVLKPASGGQNLGDAALAVDSDGNFYFATLALDSRARSYVGVAKSTTTDGRVEFSEPVLIPGLDPDAFQDKELIAVDASGGRRDGYIYLVWTEFPMRGANHILFSRSTDGGRSWSPAIKLSTSGNGVQAAMPVVGKRGELYVAWEDRSGSEEGLIRFRRSDDGGENWGPEATAARFTRMQDRSATAACFRPALNGFIRVSEFPSIDVDRSDGSGAGNIYIAYSADPGRQHRGDISDVFVVRSEDGGRTWSEPLNVVKGRAVTANADDTTNDNFMPVATVGPAGQVNVFFYDRRHDRANRKLDLYRAVSLDQGRSWSNERVTAESFDVPPLNPNFDPLVKNCYMGDYNDATVDGQGFYLTWGDNRRVIKGPRFPTGRPDPDVRFRSVGLQP